MADVRKQAVRLGARNGATRALAQDMRRNWELYLIVLPVLAYYIIFCYAPMYGAQIAFKNYSPMKGILGSSWVGAKYFNQFFSSMYFGRLLKNTLTISLCSLAFGFPVPILFALLLNEVKSKLFARTIQTVTYLPHFISLIVACSLIRTFVQSSGIITQFLGAFGMPQVNLLGLERAFVPIYVVSGIWQEFGWGSIIYLSALTGIDQQLYEAATIDGAGRWKQTLHVTLPGIMPTIVIMLILRMGNLMGVGYEKIILLYSSAIYNTSDVISTYVYRKGLLEFNWSFSTAVGLFNSVVNFGFLIGANALSKRVTGSGLW